FYQQQDVSAFHSHCMSRKPSPFFLSCYMLPSSANGERSDLHTSRMVARGFHIWSHDCFCQCLVSTPSIMSTQAHSDDASL
ncbi:unnamed protein product, partial [Closterium sp. Naga37s-1]